MREDPEAKEREVARRQAEADAARRAEAEEVRRAALSRMSPVEREMRKFLDARPDKNQTELSALPGALKKGKWTGDSRIAVAEHVKTMMQAVKKWKEKSEKKNPDKDNDYQDTLKITAWLKGQ